MTDTIDVMLTTARGLRRRPCHCCGGCTEKVNVLAEATDEAGTVFRVCESCLKAGDIDRHLAAHADALQAQAEWFRSVIGRVNVPTYAEWLDMEERVNVATFAMYAVDGYDWVGGGYGPRAEGADPKAEYDRVMSDDRIYAGWLEERHRQEDARRVVHAGACAAFDEHELPF